MEMIIRLKELVSRSGDCGMPMTDGDFSRGRRLFLAEGCCANGIVILTTGTFLSGYAAYLGAGDSVSGMIGSVPVLLCSLQMFSSVLLEGLAHKKTFITGCSFLHRLLLAAMFFVPALIPDPAGALAALMILYATAHCFGAFVGTGTGSWLISLVPDSIQGSYLGKKDALAFAFTTVLSLVMGRVLDYFKNAPSGSVQTGFMIIGGMVLFLAFADYKCLSSIREPACEPHFRKFRDVVFEPLKDREYRKVMLLYMFWNLALQIAGPFFSVYMVTGLDLSYTYITLLGVISSTVRVGAAYFWGRVADVYSWVFAARCSMCLLGMVHISWLFMTPDTYRILQPVLQALSGAAWGGISIAVFSLQYQFAPTDKRVAYVSANSSYAGLCGFLATLLGAALLRVLPKFSIGNQSVTGMQILFLISGMMILGCVRYMRCLKR